MWCTECGVGHTLEITVLGYKRMRVSLTVFPATGDTRITRRIIRWSERSAEETIGQMQHDGVAVTRDTTTLRGEPVGT